MIVEILAVGTAIAHAQSKLTVSVPTKVVVDKNASYTNVCANAVVSYILA